MRAELRSARELLASGAPRTFCDRFATSGEQLQLILCGTQAGQAVCLRERFEVRAAGGAFEVAHVAEAPPEFGSVAPLLDPPEGARKAWLDEAMTKHDFVVLLYYRGFW